MLIVADASVLVAELVRTRGVQLVRNPRISVIVAEHQWNEAEYEIRRRLNVRVAQGQMTRTQARVIELDVQKFPTDSVIEIVPLTTFEHLEEVARRRIPRDPNDWPTVAVAIALDAGIITNDHDFLGCGCVTWTFETLRDELVHAEPDVTEESAR